ncbi:MAG TPA: translation initiation factor IF-2 [Candidatus Fraserbacteria bacterium]|nr:translation initiation factor IF-2 [Candidatus Fraserbacteria bacterium]
MSKMRIYQIAREMNVSVVKLLEMLKEVGIEKAGNFSTIEADEYEVIRELFAQPANQPAPAESSGNGRQPQPAAPAPERQPTGVPRPPVVAVLGHVDHGKTTLLDAIRQSQVALKETGGITQSIGAYQVAYQGKAITFIDTPGHRAFTGMRARGAQVTDMVVLVVAADDAVMEQTREAIAHARAAEVPIIVAINKIDVLGADVQRVKEQLAKEELVPEDWGGDTIVVPLSARTHEGIDSLLEMILLEAEMLDLRADPNAVAQGTVIESYLDPARGPIASVIIRDGTLHQREVILAGAAQGRIRALLNDQGQRVNEAPPSSTVQLLGLSQVPPVGAPLEVLSSPARARQIAQQRANEARRGRLERSRRTLAQILSDTAQSGALKLLLKADSSGSLEALESELERLKSEQIKLKLLYSGVGDISESDVILASSAPGSVVIGFRVKSDAGARALAEREGVTVRPYEVIYQIADDVKRALRSLLEPEYEEEIIGQVEVRQIFKIPRVGTIAGCYVRDGVVKRQAEVRVLRAGAELFRGQIASLKRYEEDVRAVEKNKECGIKLRGFDDIREGDQMEIVLVREVQRI